MQFTILAATFGLMGAALAAPATSSGSGVEVTLTFYDNNDHACTDANAASSGGIPGTGPVGACIQTPGNTSSLTYRVPAYSTEANGCTLSLYVNNVCSGEATKAEVLGNGDLKCEPAAVGETWGSYRVTCPSS